MEAMKAALQRRRARQKSTGLSAGDKRSKDPSRLCSLGWLMATRPMVTGDLCSIVRVPPLVHTRSLLPSSSPASIPYVPLDKSIPPGEGQICKGKYYSKNGNDIIPLPRRDRGQKLVCLDPVTRVSRIDSNRRSNISSPTRKEINGDLLISRAAKGLRND